ncbi:conserved exported protein of unknown function [Denitratisoma oestradiolicum]|uniref:Cds6 C-terminal domain-containing protein n=2 Tax=Denitratisoma oestradiolicum TaxID=311182 RepID=A0A6S6Y2S9_9PROT|nr:conserved exported protein of unknown function [Denitratisoma oestradiolicum]
MKAGFLLESLADPTHSQYGKKYNMTPRCSFLPNALAASVLTLALLSFAAHADSLQDAAKLLKQNQHAQALEQVDKYLAAKPKDAQGRFLRGVILTELGRTSDAIAIFSRLTDDYPQLPEPYNNLAVIYAQQKQYDKAKQALETAIRTHPSYATAHENLGDIYTRMASQAYDKALQLDSSNSTAQTKLAMIRDLMNGATGKTTGRPAIASAPAPAVAPAIVTPVAPPTPVALAKPAEPARPVEAPKPVTVTVAQAPTPAKAAEVAPAPASETTPKASGNDANADIARTIDNWSRAWSKKDVKTYLSLYAKDFGTPGGLSRKAWEKERDQRIRKPGEIDVSFEGLKVTSNGPDQATAKFRQHYRSATLKTSTNKVLVLVKRNGKWQIQQERIGN